MGISDVTFTDQNKNPADRLSSLVLKLKELTIEAFFVDDKEQVKLTRTYIEMVLSEYAQHTQNSTVYNKWLQIDTKFEKSLKEYKSEIMIMLTGLQSMGDMQQTMEQPVANTPTGPQVATPPPAAGPSPLPTDKGAI